MSIETDHEAYLKKLLSQHHYGKDYYYNAKFPLTISVNRNGPLWEIELTLSTDIACTEGLQPISGHGASLGAAAADFTKAWERHVDWCFANDGLVFNGRA